MQRGYSDWGGGGGLMPFSFHSIPFIRALLIAIVAVFLLYFFAFAIRGDMVEVLAFRIDPGSIAWLRPWTWFTYPLLVLGPIALLLEGYWLYLVGGMLERSWGTRNLIVLFFTFTALAALAFVPAHYLFGVGFALHGLFLPLSALTVAWAAMDPEMELRLYGVLPVKLKFLAIVNVLIVYFSFGFQYGAVGPIVGLFALASPAAAWFYVRKMPRLNVGFRAPRSSRPEPPRRPLLREHPETRERPRGFDPLRRMREQKEMERLRKLLGEDDEGRSATRH